MPKKILFSFLFRNSGLVRKLASGSDETTHHDRPSQPTQVSVCSWQIVHLPVKSSFEEWIQRVTDTLMLDNSSVANLFTIRPNSTWKFFPFLTEWLAPWRTFRNLPKHSVVRSEVEWILSKSVKSGDLILTSIICTRVSTSRWTGCKRCLSKIKLLCSMIRGRWLKANRIYRASFRRGGDALSFFSCFVCCIWTPPLLVIYTTRCSNAYPLPRLNQMLLMSTQ